MTRRKVLIAIGLLILVGAIAWTGGRYTRGSGEPAADGRVTLRFFRNPMEVAPFTARDLNGRTISQESLRGKVTIVNFWATWCLPCRAEIPDLIALQDKYRDQLQVIGVSQDEETADFIRQFATEYRINYPIVMSTPELERIFSGIYALPTSFIVDREARIVQKHVGLLNPATTELETRVLAGLDITTTIEYVEADEANRKLIKDAAQATEIPGVELGQLAPAARTAVLKQLNADNCTCGCGLTLAACRINDPTCHISLPIAQKIARDAATARP